MKDYLNYLDRINISELPDNLLILDRDKFFEKYVRLSFNLAKKFRCNIDFMDLVQEANMGLVEAMNKFDFTKIEINSSVYVANVKKKNVKFITFATWVINSKLIHYVSNYSHTLKLQPKIANQINEIKKLKLLGYDEIDIKDELSLSDNQYRKILEYSEYTKTREELGYLIPDEVYEENNYSFITNLLDELSNKEKMIITYIFFDNMNYKDISDKINISVTKIKELRKSALIRLKYIIENKIYFEIFLDLLKEKIYN